MGSHRIGVEPMSARSACVAASLAMSLFGCASDTSSEKSRAPSDETAIAAVHTRKCGSCHVPPSPKSRAREGLDAVFSRHKNRVHLTPAQWAAMLDYLAASDGSTSRQPP
jgi:ABC-type uncharacterized transport system auxiliary subunit